MFAATAVWTPVIFDGLWNNSMVGEGKLYMKTIIYVLIHSQRMMTRKLLLKLDSKNADICWPLMKFCTTNICQSNFEFVYQVPITAGWPGAT